MSFSISEDIKSVSDLKKKTNEIFRQMHQTGRPIIVTVNGKPEADVKDGSVRKARDFLMKKKYGR